MATVSCQCGNVCFQFPTSKPRCTQECCCNDCSIRIGYLTSLGGPAMPKEIQQRTKPITFHYFVNRMNILKGKGQIKFFLLGDDDDGESSKSDNYNMASICCNTFLAGRSLKYSGNCVAIPVELGTLSDDVIISEQPLLRWVPDHLFTTTNTTTTTTTETTDPPTAWINKSSMQPEGSDGWESKFAIVMEAWNKPISSDEEEDKGETTTFEDILNTYKEQNGGIVEIVSKKINYYNK